MIAPSVNVLRQLVHNFKQMLGSDISTAHHPMDLTYDLPDLMESLDHHEVYVYKKGHYLDEDDLPVEDVVSTGLHDLVKGSGNPLSDYNTAFLHLQARCWLVLLVGIDPQPNGLSKVNPSLGPLLLSTMAPGDQSSPASPIIDIASSVGDAVVGDVDSEDQLEILDSEEIGESLLAYEADTEPGLSLESAADVSLDMDLEDINSCTRDSDARNSDSDMENSDSAVDSEEK